MGLNASLSALEMQEDIAANINLPTVPISSRYSVINIGAQSLSGALSDYTDQTGIGIIVNSRLIEKTTSQEINAHINPFDALRIIIGNSGLDYHRIGTKTVSLAPTAVVYPKAPPPPSRPLRPSAAATSPLEELLIIGTSKPQHTIPRGQPYTSFDSKQIQYGGYITTENILTGLPMVETSISRVNSAGFGGAAGLSFIELRGLGHNRTLVLMNGRRIASSNGGSSSLEGIDLNGIAPEDIDRIEVIRGNVAAQYGTEAIGGVINFILDRNPDGFSFSSNSGISEKMDNAYISNRLKYGTSFADDVGSISVTLSHNNTQGMLLSEREITHNLAGFAKDGKRSSIWDGVYTPGFGGSSTTPNGAILGYITGTGDVAFFPDVYGYSIAENGLTTAPTTWQPDQLYNYAEGQSLFAPFERTSIRFYGDYLFENNDVLRVEANYSQTDVHSTMSPAPLFPTVGDTSYDDPIHTISLTDPAISDDIKHQFSDLSTSGATDLIISRRLVELGQRHHDITRSTLNTNITYEGDISDLWTFDIFAQYGETKSIMNTSGHALASKLELALNTELCAQTADCVPLTLFGGQGISNKAAAYIRAPTHKRRITASQLYAEAAISGEFVLGNHPILLEFTAEHRQDHIWDASDDETDTIGKSNIVPYDSGGTVRNTALKASLDWLLVDDALFAESLQARLAVRYNDHRYAGSSINTSSSIDWQPIKGIALIAAYQVGRRAPSLSELFSVPSFNRTTFQDPCDSFQNSSDSRLVENCKIHLPATFRDGFAQTENNVRLYSEGNKSLNHEVVKSFNLGLDLITAQVWPHNSFQAQLSIDFYDVKIDNAIIENSVNTVLNLCYQSKSLSHVYCKNSANSDVPVIDRDPTSGQIQQFTVMPIGGGSMHVRGLETEISLRYSNPKNNRNSLNIEYAEVSALHHYGIQNEFTTVDGSFVDDRLGTVKYPKHRIHAAFKLGFDTWGLSWTAKIRGKSISAPSYAEIADAHVPMVIYHDVNIWSDLSDKVSLFAAVQNIFDKQAPFFAFSSASGTSPEYFDVVGRRFSMGLKLKF